MTKFQSIGGGSVSLALAMLAASPAAAQNAPPAPPVPTAGQPE